MSSNDFCNNTTQFFLSNNIDNNQSYFDANTIALFFNNYIDF